MINAPLFLTLLGQPRRPRRLLPRPLLSSSAGILFNY